MEQRSECRRFNLLDAMILVAAAAVATYLTKVVVDVDIRWEMETLAPFDVRTVLGLALGWSCPPLVVATVAFVIIRLRQPRPSLPRLSRQPGLSALSAVTGMLVLGSLVGISVLATIVLRGDTLEDDCLNWFFRTLTSSHLGTVVAGVWLVQAFSRCWRPERGWIDRCGRILGFGWIFSLLVGWWLAFYGALFTSAGSPAPVMPPPLPPMPPSIELPVEPETRDQTNSARPGTPQ